METAVQSVQVFGIDTKFPDESLSFVFPLPIKFVNLVDRQFQPLRREQVFCLPCERVREVLLQLGVFFLIDKFASS